MEAEGTPGTSNVGSLAAVVERDGPLPFVDVLGMGADIAGAIDDRGDDAHGAVQPRSVVRAGDGPWILVAPDGAGAAAALAPELTDDDAPTSAGDVYALGATMVFALTGQDLADAGFGASDEDGDGAEGTDAGDGGAAGEAPHAAPQSLPDVMALFLDTLRSTLATNPAHRIGASTLASTLRQLRSDAARVMAAPIVVGSSAVAAGAATGAATGASVFGPDGALLVEGAATTTPETTDAKKGMKDRAPILIAAAAVLLAAVFGVLLLRKGDDGSNVAATGVTTTTDAPNLASTTTLLEVVPGTDVSTTTTLATTTTTAKVTTTIPTTLPPPPTVPPTTAPPPPGTAAVTVDMSRMTTCPGCLASLRAQPTVLSQLTAQVPNGTVLWGQCWAKGDSTHDDTGRTSDLWIYIVGPATQGWLPSHLAGFQTYGLPACPQSPTTTTTTRPVTTTTAPTTTTTKKP